jgi:hypothetical protein
MILTGTTLRVIERRFRWQWNIFWGSAARVDQIKIFKLNQKD